MFKDLDRIDRKLLCALDTNSRDSFSKLAKHLKLGNDLIEYRVNQYIKSGMIEKFSVIANPFSVGWWVVKNYVKLKTNQKKSKLILDFVKNSNASFWVAEWNGRFDLLFSIVAMSPKDCRKFEQNFKDIARDAIIDYQVVLATKITKYNKKYLANNNPKIVEYLLTSETPKATLDNIDLKLISLLYENARMSLTELSKVVSLTPPTVNLRLESLANKGVILGYGFQVNYQNFGFLFFKILLQLSDYSSKFRDDLINYCKFHPNVTYFVEQTGIFPLEIEVEVPSYDVLNNFIDEFRSKYDSGISSCEILLLKKDHMHRFSNSL